MIFDDIDGASEDVQLTPVERVAAGAQIIWTSAARHAGPPT